MLLSPAERILLLNILAPAEGNAIFLRSARSLRKAVSFTDKEIAGWKIKNPSPGVFQFDGAEMVEVEISPVAHGYVADCLRVADSEGRLHEGLLRVYELFFPEE